eukprot:TRINITY_DN2449_c0_g1_i2.p1 TRINITY_DN2449_c0_g1~~TRINITY_DN2449_c0_g1_i2.p1  ORF type:complete len:804 (-),score=220.58 TRINITY_DN2449_c0_g1_i2:508-2919(-)
MKAAAFWSTFAISVVVAVVTITLFSFLRRRRKSFYIPKFFLKDAWAPKDEAYGWFAWIPATIRYPEVSLVTNPGGFDAVMYLRFLKYSGYLFTALSLFAVVVLLPINITAGGSLTGMEVSTLGNVPNGDPRLWVHLSSVFLFSVLAYVLVWKLYQDYIDVGDSLRKRADLRNRTIMVDGLPQWCMASPDALQGAFARMYGESRVVKATLVPDLRKLIADFKRRHHLVEKWKKAYHFYRESDGTHRPTHRETVRLLSVEVPVGRAVDTMIHCEREIALLDQRIARHQRSGTKRAHRMTGIGFVTFTSVSAAMQAAQTMHFREPTDVTVKLAPTSSNLIWDNMVPHVKQHKRVERGVLVIALLLLLFAGWAAPIIYISKLFTLENLSSLWAIGDFLQWLSSIAGGILAGVVQGFLSSFVVVLFFAVLPYLIRAILSIHLFRRKSSLDRAVIRTYWLFLLLNLFFISAFTITITDLFSVDILDEPQSYVRRLAQTMPTQADYFTNFVLVQGFVLLPVWWLLRLDDLAIRKFRKWFTHKTPSELRQLDAPPAYLYAIQVSRELMIFNIGLFFSSMSVLIVPFVAAYFGLEYLIAKHNFIYLYAPRYEDMKMIQPMARRILVSLILYQLFMLGIFGLQGFPYGGSLVALIVVTAVFTYWIRVRYERAAKFVPLWDCPRHLMGTGQQEVLARQEIAKQHEMNYSHPALQPPRSLDSIRDEIENGPELLQIVSDTYHEVPPNALRRNVRISTHGHLDGPAMRPPCEADTHTPDSSMSDSDVDEVGVHVMAGDPGDLSLGPLHDVDLSGEP